MGAYKGYEVDLLGQLIIQVDLKVGLQDSTPGGVWSFLKL